MRTRTRCVVGGPAGPAALCFLLLTALFVAPWTTRAALATPAATPTPSDSAALIAEYEKDTTFLERKLEILKALGETREKASTQFLILRFEAESQKRILDAVLAALANQGNELAIKYTFTLGLEQLPLEQLEALPQLFANITDNKAKSWLVGKGLRPLLKYRPEAQVALVEVVAKLDDADVPSALEKQLSPKVAPQALVSIISSLQSRKSVISISKISKLMKHPSGDVQLAVLQALLSLGGSLPERSIEHALQSKEWRVRTAAVDIVASQRDPKLIPLVLPLLDDPHDTVTVAVVEFLRILGHADVIDPLIARLVTAEGRVKDDIAEALVRLTGKDFGTSAANWESWWEANRDVVEIRGISREQYEAIKEEAASSATGLYFGLRVVSGQVTFIVDSSASMRELYTVPVKIKPGDQGRTSVPGTDEAQQRMERKQKIEVAREELIRALRQLRMGTKVNIFKFNGTFFKWQPALVRLTDLLLESAIDYAERLAPAGMTNVYDTLCTALEDPNVDTIFLLSDGAPTAGTIVDAEMILHKVAELNSLRKVKINTIGFHLDDAAERLMRRLAEQNYGRFVGM